MDLDETWQVELRPEKIALHISSEIVLCVSERARKNGSQTRCFFCYVNVAPFLPLSLDRFPPNFPRTRIQVVACNTWLHIPEKFPLRVEFPENHLFRVL